MLRKVVGVCYSGFHHTRWITHCMAFPYPAADSLYPMDHLFPFDVSLTIPKNIIKMIYAAFSPITAYIRGYSLYSHVHRDVLVQSILEFSLTWIRLIWLLAFHMPWDRTDSTFQYPFGKLYKEPLGTLKAWENFESNKTIVHCCQNYTWVCIPLSLWSIVVFFPSLPLLVSLLSEWWRIEVVEAQVGDSVSPVRRRAVRGCHL